MANHMSTINPIIEIYKLSSNLAFFLGRSNRVRLIIQVIRRVGELADHDIALILPQVNESRLIVQVASAIISAEVDDIGGVAVLVIYSHHVHRFDVGADVEIVGGHELDSRVGCCEYRCGEISLRK